MVNTTGVKCGGGGAALPLSTLNHVSLVCRSLASSLTFYRDFLGFVSVRRPGSFDFDGAWLFNYGIGIHLLQAEDPESMPPKKKEINPEDNHISFTCESMEAVQRRLKEMGVRYVQRRVEEGGVYVDGGPDLLPRPRRLHDRDLHLRQAPRRPPRRRRRRPLHLRPLAAAAARRLLQEGPGQHPRRRRRRLCRGGHRRRREQRRRRRRDDLI